MKKKPRKIVSRKNRTGTRRWVIPTAIAITIALASGITCALTTVWLMGPQVHSSLLENTKSEILAEVKRDGAIDKINGFLGPYHATAKIEGDTLFLYGELPSEDAIKAILNLVRVGLKVDVLDVLTESGNGTDLVELHPFGRPDGNSDRPAGTRAATVFNHLHVAAN